jgi:hypothetical protein
MARFAYFTNLHGSTQNLTFNFRGLDYRVPMTETILYGLPKDATERYEEVLLLTNATPAMIERCKVLAAKDGFHSFRVAQVDLSKAPNFGKSLVRG